MRRVDSERSGSEQVCARLVLFGLELCTEICRLTQKSAKKSRCFLWINDRHVSSVSESMPVGTEHEIHSYAQKRVFLAGAVDVKTLTPESTILISVSKITWGTLIGVTKMVQTTFATSTQNLTLASTWRHRENRTKRLRHLLPLQRCGSNFCFLKSIGRLNHAFRAFVMLLTNSRQ